MAEGIHYDAATLKELAAGSLPAAEAAKVRAHLDRCPDCASLARSAAQHQTDLGATIPHGQEALGPAEPAALGPGKQLGRYIILERLGAGGMAEVYSAIDPHLGRKVALKILRADVLAALGASRGRSQLLAEAQALARLSHPNVVAVYDVGVIGDEVWIAMEFVEGVTLTAWLKEKPRGWREALPMFVAAGRGLAAAHGAGLVHRDFKPLNVLVGNDGRVRVADFGLARSIAAPDPNEPWAAMSPPTAGQTTSTAGTPAYMSPEQHAGQVNLDARSDQYSFCISLFEALHRARPASQAATLPEDAPGQPRERSFDPPPKSDVPAWLHRAIVRGLAMRPEDRYPSMDALIRALEKDPAIARRRALTVAVPAALVLLGAGAAVLQQRAKTERCAAPVERWSGVWDHRTPASIRAAFAATGRPFASAAADKVEGSLSAYRAAWMAAYRETCLATRVRGDQSEELLDLKMECLARKLGEVKALTSAFLSADPGVVGNAGKAAADLPALAECEDAAGLRNVAAWPLDPAKKDQVEAARVLVAGVRAMFATGKRQGSLEAATKAAEATRATGYTPLIAEAELLLGKAQANTFDYASSLATLHRAAGAALTTGRFELLADVWATFSQVSMLNDQSATQGQLWTEYAEAAIQRMTGDRRSATAKLRRHQSRVAHALLKHEEGLRLAQEGLQLAEAVYGKAHPLVAESYSAVSTSYWYLGRIDKSIEYGEIAIQIHEQLSGHDHPDVAKNLADFAELYLEQGDVEKAERSAREAVRILAATMGPDNPLVSLGRMALGHSLAYAGKSDEALAAGKEGFESVQAKLPPGHPMAIEFLSRLAEIQRVRGDCAAAIPLAEKALALRDKAEGKDEIESTPELRVLGECQLQKGDFTAAAMSLRRAMDEYEKGGSEVPDNVFAAEARFLLAKARAGIGDAPGARADAEGALATFEKVGTTRAKKGGEAVKAWLAAAH